MLLIFNRSPLTFKSPLIPSVFKPRVWTHACGSVPGAGGGPAPTLAAGRSLARGDLGRDPPCCPGNLREPEKRRRSGEKQLAFNKPSPEPPAQRFGFSPPAKPLLYPKKNSGDGARGSAERRVPPSPLPSRCGGARPRAWGRPPGAAGTGAGREGGDGR